MQENVMGWRNIFVTVFLFLPNVTSWETFFGLPLTDCLSHNLLVVNYKQVNKECTKSVHSICIPQLNWVFYHCVVHSFYTFSHHSIYTPLTMIEYRKPVKAMSLSSKPYIVECKTSANKWQTSGHVHSWSTWAGFVHRRNNHGNNQFI